MDCADIAERNMEIQLANQIKATREKYMIEADIEDGHSFCLHCGADLGEVKEGEPVKRWCDSSCRDMWQKENPEA